MGERGCLGDQIRLEPCQSGQGTVERQLDSIGRIAGPAMESVLRGKPMNKRSKPDTLDNTMDIKMPLFRRATVPENRGLISVADMGVFGYHNAR